jgi:hypothetical protein
MQRTLAAAVPGFRAWKWSEFLPAIREAEPVTERSTPFAVIADFNDDGRVDVVIAGDDSAQARVVALMSDATSVRLVQVMDLPLERPDERRPRSGYVKYVPAGIINADTLDERTLSPPRDEEYEMMPVKLERDAFELVRWQQGSSVFYWRDGRFVQWMTSD